jgi:hypothetical protein
MSGNRIVFEGLDELRAELLALPDALTGEASHILEAAANAAAADIKAGYHVVTGELRDGLTVTQRSAGRFGAAFTVRNTSRLAWLYDNGSQARHWLSGKSTGTMWGKTAPTHLFVGTVIRRRRSMYEALKALVARHGLTVSGDA